MIESLGVFDRDVKFVGVLGGSELSDGNIFTPEDNKENSAYGMGNRINLYIMNAIDYIEDEPPPQYGLMLEWYFKSTERQVPNATPSNTGNNIWAHSALGNIRTSWKFNEMFIENEDALPVNPHVKAASGNYNMISLPNKKVDNSEGWFSQWSARANLVIPVTALGDYMRIRFYSYPTSHKYLETDWIRIWACAGYDAQGAINRSGFK